MKRLLALAAVVVAVWAAPAGAGPPGLVLDVEDVTVGGTTFAGPVPTGPCLIEEERGESVEVRLVDGTGAITSTTSTPVRSDGSWSAAVTVPADAEPGRYTVQATCNPDGLSFEYVPEPVSVIAGVVPDSATTTTVPSPSTTIADDGTAVPVVDEDEPSPYGAEEVGWLGVASMALLALSIGLGIWLRARVLKVRHPGAIQQRVGRVVMAGAAAFTAGWVVADLVNTDLSPVDEYVSALASPQAEQTWILTLALLVGGAATVLVAFVGEASLRKCRARVTVPALALGLAGVMTFNLAWLRSDCLRTDPECAAASTSWHHGWHTMAGWLAVLGFVVAAFGLWWLLKGRSSPKDEIGRGTLPFAVALLSGPLFLLEVVGPNGLVQRAFLLAAAAWVAWLGWSLVRHTNRR